MSKLLQIAILSRDRADFLKEAVDSALMQSGSELDYEIIISDNSEKDDVNKLVNKYYLTNKKIKYIRRNPTLSDLYLHCELVISEFNSKYAVIFHDDDILHPDYIEKMTPLLSNESIVSVGCNAKIFNNNIIDSTKRMHNFNSLKIFNSKKDFLQQYLDGDFSAVSLRKFLPASLRKFPRRHSDHTDRLKHSSSAWPPPARGIVLLFDGIRVDLPRMLFDSPFQRESCLVTMRYCATMQRQCSA